jgi:hypothetical protein
MITTLKELFVVLLIACTVFALARPIVSIYIAPDDASRRRRVWFVVTIAAFLCPNFLVFAIVVIPFLVAAGRKDSNPGALFLFLMNAVPLIPWRVPMVGISFLIDIDFPMLLSFCVMVPAALRLRKSTQQFQIPPSRALDISLLCYLGLTSFYFVLPEISRGVLMTPTFTDCLRRALESFVEIYIPFYVLSRTASSLRQIQELFAAFCLSCAIMAAIGAFEGAKHWLLYLSVRDHWGNTFGAYLFRGESLRAMASTTHALVLGYLLAVASGLWLCLKLKVASKLSRNAVSILYWLGLLAAYSRGPWLGGAAIYFIYTALRRGAVSGFFKAAIASASIAAVIALSPLGTKIAQVIPYFGGTVDEENISYRERLLSRAWEIIQDSPFLGDQHSLSRMEDLRQGEGIIDLMNGFVNILLDNGFIGLLLFLSFVLIGVFKAWVLSRETAQAASELSAMCASLVACILGLMIMMWVGGQIVPMTCILVALASACTRLAERQTRAVTIAPGSVTR